MRVCDAAGHWTQIDPILGHYTTWEWSPGVSNIMSVGQNNESWQHQVIEESTCGSRTGAIFNFYTTRAWSLVFALSYDSDAKCVGGNHAGEAILDHGRRMCSHLADDRFAQWYFIWWIPQNLRTKVWKDGTFWGQCKWTGAFVCGLRISITMDSLYVKLMLCTNNVKKTVCIQRCFFLRVRSVICQFFFLKATIDGD